MKKMDSASMKEANGGKTAYCSICHKNVKIGFLFFLPRFWWSDATWRTYVASEHYQNYGCNYNPNVHKH